MNTKIHPWPTRKNPDTQRYEVLIAGVWRSRQYAWQLLRRMENKCKQCGRDALRKDYPFCRRCARVQSIRQTGKWGGPQKQGKRGRPPHTMDDYTKMLPRSRG